ncbi:MAG: response regulator [bacterium]
MKWGNSIRKNTALGISFIVILVITSSTLGFIYTWSVREAVGTVRNKSNQLERLTHLEENWLRIISTVDNILLTRQGTQVEARLEPLLDDFNHNLEDIELSFQPSSPEVEDQNSRIIGELKIISGKLDSVFIEFVEVINKGQWSRAQFIRHNDLSSLQRELELNLNLLDENINIELNKSIRNSVSLMNKMRLFWILTAVLAILFGLFVLYLTSRSILRPITLLVDKSKQIIDGDYSVRIKAGRNNEFDVLAGALNSMTEGFQNLIQELKDEISERKKAETALIESEKKFKDIYEHAVEGIFQTTLDGRFLNMNPAMVHYLGYDSKEDLLEECVDIEKQLYVVPEERKKYISKILSKGRIMDHPVQLYRKDGKKIWMSLNTRLVRGEDGQPPYLEGFATDISERKNLLEQLHQAQKMEAIGRLAGGIAHDFNNILTVILCYCDILLRSNLSSSANQAVQEMQAASEKAKRMTSQLLAFSRKQVVQPKIVNLNDIIVNQYNMLNRILGEDIQIKLSLNEDIAEVKIDPGQVDQIIMNLVVNARDAMPDGGILIIETANADFIEETPQSKQWIPSGKYVMLSVSDTGIGMDEQVKSRLFEPFFTTKSKSKGTGLGLATVYGIVKQNSGFIYVYSEIDKGSTFKIYFPQTQDKTDEYYMNSRKDVKTKSKKQTILLVEDDPGVRLVTENTLTDYGYRIISAESGEQAIELFNENKDNIAIVLTDVVMPNMSGKELAEILLKEKESLKVIYMSGYTEDSIMKTKGLVKDVNFLQKPFTTDELIKMIRKQ